MTPIVIELWGVAPQQQGSKNPWGGDTNKHLHGFREKLAENAATVMREGGHKVIDGPVRLDVDFVFERPASHFGTGKNEGLIKSSAPVWKQSVPDRDKLLRAIGDALTKVVYRDDARIVDGNARKVYVGFSPQLTHTTYKQQGVHIEIRAL